MALEIQHTVVDRFVRYAKIDTQSDPNSTTFPSTEKQKNLARLLVEELLEMGITDAHMDEHGYVYASIPSNTEKEVPVVCFCSHMDTAPDCSGKDVEPIIHRNYQGGDIHLPYDGIVLKASDHPDFKNQIGNDIITADGRTLLGADNKAGVAEIMDAAHFLMTYPEVKHGKISILFTPDEEVGRGVDYVSVEKIGADFGYTVDGEALGHIEDQTFSADGVEVVVHGLSIHPGFAKGRMENAVKIVADIVHALPKDRLSPETTAGSEGFIHPTDIGGIMEKASAKFIVRDFTDEKLQAHEDYLKSVVEGVMENYPNSSYEFIVTEQYRNMKEILDQRPEIVQNALDAMERSGMNPVRGSIRGGTDGSRLSYMGLPCPNIFAGEHAFHSKEEWVSIHDMQKAVETIINIAILWEERA